MADWTRWLVGALALAWIGCGGIEPQDGTVGPVIEFAPPGERPGAGPGSERAEPRTDGTEPETRPPAPDQPVDRGVDPDPTGEPAVVTPFVPQDLLLWEGKGNVQPVGFSPDGQMFAFLTDVELLEGTLNLIDLQTFEVRKVDDQVVWAVGPHAIGFSDDGRELVYRRSHDDPALGDWTFQSALWRWSWDGEGPVQVAEMSVRSGYRITPDGEQIVFARTDKSIWVHRVATGEEQAIAETAWFSVYGNVMNAMPISEDSRFLALVTGYKYGAQIANCPPLSGFQVQTKGGV